MTLEEKVREAMRQMEKKSQAYFEEADIWGFLGTPFRRVGDAYKACADILRTVTGVELEPDNTKGTP